MRVKKAEGRATAQDVADAKAYREIQRRSRAAHAYAQKYLMPKDWGRNVWHAILDDARRLRKQLWHLETRRAD